ncbi:MAG TPA: hypothetical protein VKB35_17415 [Ktedonobacteraceae bacterium]|nr:hypothetical protein [Ktedonobacteraceae bacterium]
MEAGLECIPPSAADRVAGEKPVEGHPAEAGQARSADEHTRKAGGAIVGPKEARSSPCALADSTWVNNLPECGRNAGRPD